MSSSERFDPVGLADGVTTIDPTVDSRWSEFLAGRQSDVFQSSKWLGVLSATYGLEIQAAVLVRDGEVVAGLPYVIVDFPTQRIVTLPFSDYCDPLVDSAEDWELVTAELLERGLPMRVRCLRNGWPLRDGRFELTTRARWHAVDLQPVGDDPWGSISSSARRAIRRSRESSVVVRSAQSEDDLRRFYDLHLGIRKRKYRLLAQPFSFFLNLWHEFVETGRGTLLLAHVGDRVVAGVFFLEWEDALYYKFNASDPACSEVRANDAVMWAGIEYGRSRGCRLLDLGLSDWDQEGLVRYKQKYAGNSGVISFLDHRPPGPSSPAGVDPLAGLLPKLTDLFTDDTVPDEVTERAGDLLYRFFA